MSPLLGPTPRTHTHTSLVPDPASAESFFFFLPLFQGENTLLFVRQHSRQIIAPELVTIIKGLFRGGRVSWKVVEVVGKLLVLLLLSMTFTLRIIASSPQWPL